MRVSNNSQSLGSPIREDAISVQASGDADRFLEMCRVPGVLNFVKRERYGLAAMPDSIHRLFS